MILRRRILAMKLIIWNQFDIIDRNIEYFRERMDEEISRFKKKASMKILITGAGGFIGSHLTERIVRLGHEVRAFVRYNSNNQWGWLDKSACKNDLEIVCGDIRDFDSVHRAMKSCHVVFHLAALIGIPYSYLSPLSYIKTNIEGTYNILEAARTLELDQVLVTSTSETYGTAQYIPIDEQHPVVGQSPYSASKIAADQMSISYYRSFSLPLKIIRPFNTYGPRQSLRAIIPTIMSQVLAGRDKINLGNIGPTRDFTFVLDTVEAFLEIWKSPDLIGEVVNIGMNEEISVGDLSSLIMELAGREAVIFKEDARIRPQQSEVEHLRCNNKKLLARTAWRPRYDIRQGLKETMVWLNDNIASFKADRYHV